MAGHRVFQAYDGQAARELCRSLNDVALLVLNTHVDGMNGADLVCQIREYEPGMSILHIDTHRDPTIPQDIPTLAEPFTAVQLLTLVDGMLAGGENGRAASNKFELLQPPM